jgi:hypothetical protein
MYVCKGFLHLLQNFRSSCIDFQERLALYKGQRKPDVSVRGHSQSGACETLLLSVVLALRLGHLRHWLLLRLHTRRQLKLT